MRFSICLIVLVVYFNPLMGQHKNAIKKSWIKVSIEYLTGTGEIEDSIYMRYNFEKDIVNFSMDPSWDGLSMSWELTKNGIRIGIIEYTFKELTDTSMVIEEKGIRKIRLLSEDYLLKNSPLPLQIDTFDGKPVYLGNNIVTARYQNGKSLGNELGKLSNGYNIRKWSRFRMQFIVNEKGEVHNVKVVEGITTGFDNTMATAIKKTSKKWTPATHNGQPIQILLTFESKYLNSSSIQNMNE